MGRDGIAANIALVRERITAACEKARRSPDEVTLVAVTKGFGPEAIREAVAAGITDVGENRVQEARSKRAALTDVSALTWHLLGHLQTNKVKDALHLFDTIQSIDSLHLAEAISKRASIPVPVFVEVNVAQEASKSGSPLERLSQTLETMKQMHNLDVRGLMTVAPLAATADEVRPVFRRLREAAMAAEVHGLSMGMTNDFEVAIEEGATHIRVGRAIFGERSQ